jgi:hypothetical protein
MPWSCPEAPPVSPSLPLSFFFSLSFSAFSSRMLPLSPSLSSLPPAGPCDALLSGFLHLWCEGFDSLASSKARKTCALAMSRLLAMPSPAVLHNLDAMLVCITGEEEAGSGGREGE